MLPHSWQVQFPTEQLEEELLEEHEELEKHSLLEEIELLLHAELDKTPTGHTPDAHVYNVSIIVSVINRHEIRMITPSEQSWFTVDNISKR